MKADSSYIMFNAAQRMLEFRLSAEVWKEGRWYLARCPELKMTDQGKTTKDVIRNLTDMVIISLAEAIESNNIDGMLKELGFKRSKVPVPTVSIYEIPADKYVNLMPLTYAASIPVARVASIEYTPAGT